ncbi:MAG: hypothetical protein PHD21_03155 [Flavobacteriales bacterium]|nr:hypothetical protein [Flavobacteriales bacterium]
MIYKKYLGFFTFIASLAVVSLGMFMYYGAWALMAVPELLGTALTLAICADVIFLLFLSKDTFKQKIMKTVLQSILLAFILTVLLFFLAGKDILHL